MDKYLQKVREELAHYDLTEKDLTKRELQEMLQEAKELEDPYMLIDDGYFGGTALFSISLRKEIVKNEYGERAFSELTKSELATLRTKYNSFD